MEILPKRIYETLKDKGVSTIYHANSVMAACGILRSRCLLSPGSTEKLGLFHHSRTSSKLGKYFGIWDDVFTETADSHQVTRSPNSHGPVMFELDTEIIRSTYNGRAWVTKSNPADWETNTLHERRWFSSAIDLEQYFTCNNTDLMTLFRHCGGKLHLSNHLRRIILDDPKLTLDGEVDCYSMAYGALSLAMAETGLQVPIVRRACDHSCDCQNHYLSEPQTTAQMFSPCHV